MPGEWRKTPVRILNTGTIRQKYKGGYYPLMTIEYDKKKINFDNISHLTRYFFINNASTFAK